MESIDDQRMKKEVLHNALNRYDFAAMTLIVLHALVVTLSWELQFRGVVPDTLYHLLVGKMYYEEGFVAWDLYQYGPLGRPQLYPPLFHLMISTLRTLGMDFLDVGRILSITQWVGSLLSTWLLTRSLFSSRSGLLSVALLSNVTSFWSWEGTATPTGLSIAVFPALIYCLLRRMRITTIFLLSIFLWMHLGYPYIMILSLALFCLTSPRYRSSLPDVVSPLSAFVPWLFRLLFWRDWILPLQVQMPIWTSLLPQNLFLLFLFPLSFFVLDYGNDDRVRILLFSVIGAVPALLTYGGMRFTHVMVLPAAVICAVVLDRLLQRIRRGKVTKVLLTLLVTILCVSEVCLSTAEIQDGIRGTDPTLQNRLSPLVRGVLGTILEAPGRIESWEAWDLHEYDGVVDWIRRNTGPDEVLHVSDRGLSLYLSLQTDRRVDTGMYPEVGSAEMYSTAKESWLSGGTYVLRIGEDRYPPGTQLISEERFVKTVVQVRVLS